MVSRLVHVDGIDLQATLAPLAMLHDDPTVKLVPGRFERATATPDGPAAMTVEWPRQPQAVGDSSTATAECAEVTASGDGAACLLARAPRLLGAQDDVTGFNPAHARLRELWRRHRGARMTATATLWHDLAWTIVQQRVHRLDAAAQWRRLVLTYGTPAGNGSGLTTRQRPPS